MPSTGFAITAPARRDRRRRAARSFVGSALLAAVAVVALVMLVPAALGYQRYVLVSGSMTGTYDTGSIVYAKEVPTEDLRVGDVITYAPPAGASPQELVTHRITWMGDDGRGHRAFQTKGDANPTADPWKFVLDEPTQARVSFGVGHLGYAISALGRRDVRMVLIGLPAVLLALFTVGRLLRDARREAAAARTAAPTPAAAQ
ncbi:signal peptidase I [Conexibacter sp. SYSU D00693]|uniref:signal peptidase I n=1 Tax=Conexibacter sp. SYSU D00693 TaxID=2812560 RepID=UPI00196BAF93|nr:signal peptidase I [Conexibacter sp. SYSU D00693]